MRLLRIPTILLLLLTLPRAIALFIYPDGSRCWECTVGTVGCDPDTRTAPPFLQGDGFQCSTATTACGGVKLPDGYVVPTYDPGKKENRICGSWNGCIHACAFFISEDVALTAQVCCFKEGSPVRSLLFRVRGVGGIYEVYC